MELLNCIVMNRLFLLIISALALSCCTSEFEESPNEECTTHVDVLQMDASIIGFDDEAPSKAKTRRGSSSLIWADGDQLYLFFEVGNTIVPGVATYNADKDQWTLAYTGTLSVVANANVQTYFIKNATKSPGVDIGMNEQTCVFMDSIGKYSLLADGEVRVMSSLSATTGRIRFKGKAGQSFKLQGIATNSSFNMQNATIITANDDIILSVLDDGYTPYIYGSFINKERIIRITSDYCVFEKQCDNKVLAKGKSGWMNVPDRNDLSNWEIIPILPTIQTKDPTISDKSATLFGILLSDGGEALLDCGFYYGTNIDCNNVVHITPDINFPQDISSIISVSGDSTYYYKSFATNTIGTVYGETISFAPPSSLATVSTINAELTHVTGSDWTCKAEGYVTDSGNRSIFDYGFIICRKYPSVEFYDAYSAVNGRGTGSNVLSYVIPSVSNYSVPLVCSIPLRYSSSIPFSYNSDYPEVYVYSYVVNTQGTSLSQPIRAYW